MNETTVMSSQIPPAPILCRLQGWLEITHCAGEGKRKGKPAPAIDSHVLLNFVCLHSTFVSYSQAVGFSWCALQQPSPMHSGANRASAFLRNLHQKKRGI